MYECIDNISCIMNKTYVDKLIKCGRNGTLIKIIKENENNWSVDDFQYVFDECIEHKLYDIFYFLMEIFNKRSFIDFINNKKCYGIYGKYYINKVFIWACENGHLKIVSYLLLPKMRERYPNINPSERNNCGLLMAFKYRKKEIVKYLLSPEIQKRYPQIDPSAKDNFGIMQTYLFGYVEILKYLLSVEIQERFPKIDPYTSNNNGFIWTCESGRIKIIKYLLSPEVQERYPKLHPDNLGYGLIYIIEKLLGYSVQSTNISNNKN